MKKFLATVSLLAFTLCSYAMFDEQLVGGRYTALGLANIVNFSDSYSVIYNPSGISSVEGLNVSVNYAEPYGLSGLNIYNANVVVDIPDRLSVGVGYISYGVDFNVLDGLRESIGYLAVSKLFGLDGFFDALSIGISGKFMMASVKGFPFNDGSNRKDVFSFSSDVGITAYLLGRDMGISLVGYNVVPTRIYFVDSNNFDTAPTYLKLGFSWMLVKPYMNVFASFKYMLQNSSTSLSVGAEISFADTIFTRLGLLEGNLSGGLGIRAPNFELNFGTQVKADLGWYYQVDILFFIKELFGK